MNGSDVRAFHAALTCGAQEKHNAVLKGLSQVYSVFSQLNSKGACACAVALMRSNQIAFVFALMRASKIL